MRASSISIIKLTIDNISDKITAANKSANRRQLAAPFGLAMATPKTSLREARRRRSNPEAARPYIGWSACRALRARNDE